ncbi:MAG: DEAD/DEAH box helicase [Gemmatimonadota bacterium]
MTDLDTALPAEPAAAARQVLETVFPRPPGLTDAPPLPLAPFQAEAAARILRLLEVRGGALLADSVGLGKTHIAIAVIAESIRRGCDHILVVTPASLRRQWVGPLRRLARDRGAGFAGPIATPVGVGPLVRWTSHARLSRGNRPPGRPALVVVDEAHAFRNPRTRRYRELAALCAGARVLLVTATPVNNSLSDLYFLLRLFLGDGALADLGVADLRAFLRCGGEEAGPAPGRSAVAALTVRRTRRTIEGTPGGTGLRFPIRETCDPVPYELASGWGRVGLDRLIGLIAELEFHVHDVAAGPGRGASHLVRAALLKRLESSLYAFERSIARLESFLRACAAGIPFGRLPCGGDVDAADPGQLTLAPLFRGTTPVGIDRTRLADSVAADLDRIHRIRALLRGRSGPDPKLEALRNLLAKDLAGRRVLIFTEFGDTARYLHRALTGTWPTGLVTGRDSRLGAGRAQRRRVIEAFAPVANGVAIPGTAQIRILIATDVLSEGLNLQDAGDLVSFDLPWNPIRLVQRAGRIDRPGSRHRGIRIHNFLPDRGLDEILGLMDRIRSKLGAIRAIGGFDTVPLSDPADRALPDMIRRLRSGDPKLLQDLELQTESGFEVEERARRAVAAGSTGAARGVPVGPAADRLHGSVTDPQGRAVPGATIGLPRAPPVLATLERPAGEAPGWLAVATDGRVERFVLVRRDRAFENRETALRILADAVAAGTTAGARPLAALGADPASSARRAIELVVRHIVPDADRPARRPGPAGRAARLLLRRLGSEPGGPAQQACARADVILDRLRLGLGRGAEAELEAALRSEAADPGSSGALLDRLESLAAPDRSTTRDRHRLVGLFRLSPRADLVLEPGPG